ncbi:Sperm-associated antigen, putative [Pediculus humanus corporis]|uniref:Sperm-associated antigen, putative n=1 Tax=Pediculus humanus subsp. corporis TaxID=121224 RepID=E0VFD1_PEDHC|nr:Sperm-associated antigen, putative [Pediculus humanus corporis]EEB12087.1 Sperm-associated antigen, putative [Pediculus humanus corporis]
MDLLGSILQAMDKPPSCSEKQKMIRKKEKEEFLKRQKEKKEVLKKFRQDVENKLSEFLQDVSLTKYEFEPADKVFRSVIHDAAEVAGVAGFTIGEEDIDRRVIVYKKEFSPSEEELAALRRGEEWDPEKAKLLARQKELEMKKEEEERMKNKNVQPTTNYMDKYTHLIGAVAAKDAAQKTQMNKQYGFVPAENKRDQRSIEQTLADIQNKKRLKTSHPTS